VAGRFDSAAGGCAAQQITRRVLLSHAILDADYEQAMADGQTFSVINETRTYVVVRSLSDELRPGCGHASI
jgi:hypothetical protein